MRSEARSFARVSLVAAVLLTAGCLSILGGEQWERVPGSIDVESVLQGSLAVPAEATVGVPFQITVTTYGSSSCTRPGDTETGGEGLVAVVRPFDWSRTGDAVCTADLRAYSRTVALRFDEAGEATVRLIGQEGQVERTVQVRP